MNNPTSASLTWRDLPPLDAAQARRIEAEHNGFLYQHLYAVGCLLLALPQSIDAVRVEGDEDIELLRADGVSYLQIKFRTKPLSRTDVNGFLDRCAELRAEHVSSRVGSASFYLVTNTRPAPILETDIATLWPKDVLFHGATTASFLPPACGTVEELFQWCVQSAAQIPLRVIGADTLVWKLAAMVQAACAGKRRGHTFLASELPDLFEQLIVQLQSFPLSPRPYRPHENEPSYVSAERVRVITGPSGTGKSAWAANASENASEICVYYDVAIGQGSTLASGITREIAARVFASSTNELHRILLPGASGLEALIGLHKLFASRSMHVTVFVDNAHLADTTEICAIINVGDDAIQWVLLAQPWFGSSELEARASIVVERLEGWAIETIAAVFQDHDLIVSPDVARRVRRLTGGLPLFVREFVTLTQNQGTSPDQLCTELEDQVHLTQTRQEAILQRTIAAAPPTSRSAAVALAIADYPLKSEEVRKLIQDGCGLGPADAARAARDLTARGVISPHRDGRTAMHDAFRLAVLSTEYDTDLVIRCRHVLKEILLSSLRHGLDAEQLLAFLRLLPLLGELAAFVDIVSRHGEQIHELGLMSAIARFIHSAANNVALAPADRFWALDMLIFITQGSARSDALAAMSKIVATDGALLGRAEHASFFNKSILVRAEAGDLGEAREAFAAAMKFAETQEKKLVIRYTLAHACFVHKRWREAERSAQEIVKDYYELLGLDESDVDFQQPAAIIAKLALRINDVTILKHVGDCHALVAMARDQLGKHPSSARIHAMKFYSMAQAPVSAVRQGLDAASDFLRFGSDLNGAFTILDNHVEQLVREFRLIEFVVPVASMRAVLLAYSGKTAEARALIEKFTPLADGMTGPERENFDRQRALVAELAANPNRWLRH